MEEQRERLRSEAAACRAAGLRLQVRTEDLLEARTRLNKFKAGGDDRVVPEMLLCLRYCDLLLLREAFERRLNLEDDSDLIEKIVVR
eukprot:9656038-Lingulodinium_polyedra.AAC.1